MRKVRMTSSNAGYDKALSSHSRPRRARKARVSCGLVLSEAIVIRDHRQMILD